MLFMQFGHSLSNGFQKSIKEFGIHVHFILMNYKSSSNLGLICPLSLLLQSIDLISVFFFFRTSSYFRSMSLCCIRLCFEMILRNKSKITIYFFHSNFQRIIVQYMSAFIRMENMFIKCLDNKFQNLCFILCCVIKVRYTYKLAQARSLLRSAANVSYVARQPLINSTD